MRSTLLSLALLGLTASAAGASTLDVVLGLSQSTGTVLSATPNVEVQPNSFVNVFIFAKADTLQGSPSDSVATANSGGQGWLTYTRQFVAGGIRGFQFTVASTGTTDQARYLGNTSLPSLRSSEGFTLTQPTAHDVDSDTDPDADAGSFDSATALGTDIGTSSSATLLTTGPFAGYDLIATEQWYVPTTWNGNSIPLTLSVADGTYYDSTNPNDWRSDFTTIHTTGATIGIPEPATLSLLAIGALPLAARRRR